MYKVLEHLIFKLLSIGESPFLLKRLYVPFVQGAYTVKTSSGVPFDFCWRLGRWAGAARRMENRVCQMVGAKFRLAYKVAYKVVVQGGRTRFSESTSYKVSGFFCVQGFVQGRRGGAGGKGFFANSHIYIYI